MRESLRSSSGIADLAGPVPPLETLLTVLSQSSEWLRAAPMLLAITGSGVGEYLGMTERNLKHSRANQLRLTARSGGAAK